MLSLDTVEVTGSNPVPRITQIALEWLSSMLIARLSENRRNVLQDGIRDDRCNLSSQPTLP